MPTSRFVRLYMIKDLVEYALLKPAFENSDIHFYIENEHVMAMSGALIATGDSQAWIMVERDQEQEATDLLKALGLPDR